MTDPHATDETPGARSLHRDLPERKLLGVAAALARYFGAPVTLVRLGFFLFTLLHGVGLLIYLAAAAFLPGRAGESALAERVAWGVRRFGEGFHEGRPGSGSAGRP